jgi:hypothetical protein
VKAIPFCWTPLLIVLLVSPSISTGSESSAPVIRLRGDSSPTVDVAGLRPGQLKLLGGLRQSAEQWQSLFAVYVAKAHEDIAGRPAMLGSYRVEEGVLRFEPRFPLMPGVSYRAVLHVDRLPGEKGTSNKPVETLLLLPRRQPAVPTTITQVYPSKDALPENQLKFYLHFSAPMSRGEAYERISLLDASGKKVEGAFLELGQELWDPAGKRFTLFIDPGRIKRGLVPREEFGPVLRKGQRYTLVIDRRWLDAEGSTLKETYRKSFRVLAPDETSPDPKTWKVTAPSAGSRTPLVVVSPKSLDHALLHRLLWVTDPSGQKVPGTIEVTHEETHWRFTPASPWTAGRFHLVADTRLEDLAGNSIGQPFEVDEVRRSDREIKSETVQIPFAVSSRAPSP